jgi:glc operon protein GlcG
MGVLLLCVFPELDHQTISISLAWKAKEGTMTAYRRLIVSVSVIGFLAGVATASAQLMDKKGLTLEAAKKIAAAAEEEAVKNKWTVVIAIVDEGGNLVYLQRLDETQIGSIEVAIQKAKTAVSFKRPSKALEDAVLTGGRTVVLSLPGALPIEGGVPLVVNDKVIGAIGVSGVTAQQDGQIAKAGVDALAKLLGR